MLEQVGLETLRHGFSQRTSEVELQSGHPAEAVAQLQRARDELERLGERAYRSTCIAYLANALYVDGRGDEAEETALAAEAESAEDDVINFAVAHGVRARVAADRGEVETAERLAASAVGYAFRMDMPKPRGDALVARACVLRTIGRLAEAEGVFAEAIAVYERKGELAAAAWARQVFEEA
jgi:ATP/maltotriose-dependent transcriptional regulator MalT